MGWRPFLDPMPADDGWVWLAVPLVLLISLVYKAVRGATMDRIAVETLRMAVQILVVLLGIAMAIWAVTSVF